MKKLSICFLLFFSAVTLPIIAEETKQQTNHTQLQMPPLKHGPRTSIISWIDCHYTDGQLYLNPSEDIGDMYVSITDMSTGICRNFSVPVDDAVISITLDNGNYYIECTTSQGVTYEGKICINL